MICFTCFFLRSFISFLSLLSASCIFLSLFFSLHSLFCFCFSSCFCCYPFFPFLFFVRFFFLRLLSFLCYFLPIGSFRSVTAWSLYFSFLLLRVCLLVSPFFLHLLLLFSFAFSF